MSQYKSSIFDTTKSEKERISIISKIVRHINDANREIDRYEKSVKSNIEILRRSPNARNANKLIDSHKKLRDQVQEYSNLASVLIHGYKSVPDDKTESNIKNTEEENKRVQESFDNIERDKIEAILNYEEYADRTSKEPLDEVDEDENNAIKALAQTNKTLVSNIGKEFKTFAETLVTSMNSNDDAIKNKELISQRFFLENIKPEKISLEWELLRIEEWQEKNHTNDNYYGFRKRRQEKIPFTSRKLL